VSSRPATLKLRNHIAQITPAKWLIAAAAFHLVIAVAIFLIGHFRLLPNYFDQYGIGITFAIDGVAYRRLIAEMAEVLLHRGLSTWIDLHAPLHCRLYSLAFAFPGSLLGHNILAAEALNLPYYLGILRFIYALGKEIFGSRAGLTAAAIVAVWPSFLLHSTQLIRDSVSILFMLALLFILVVLLGRQLSWARSLWAGIVAVVLVVAFWLTRGNMWNIVIVALTLTVVLFAVRIVRERKLFSPNIAVVLVLLAVALFVPTSINSTTLPGTQPPTAVIAISSHPNARFGSFWTRFIAQIRARRGAFRFYTGQGSNIDADVNFSNVADVAKYLPRAAVIGVFAPFPRMWVESGWYGRAGRLVAGLETCLMYLPYLPAIVCVWSERRKLPMWLLFLTSFVGMVALGLMVVNAGTLYRLRYLFWILTIVLAAEGLLIVKRWRL
jgi:hypothetical protein